jgi:hypothetical protein
MVPELEALDLVAVERLSGKAPRVTLLEPETIGLRGSYSCFLS